MPLDRLVGQDRQTGRSKAQDPGGLRLAPIAGHGATASLAGQANTPIPTKNHLGDVRRHGHLLDEISLEREQRTTPVHIDPERPAMSISHPKILSNFLAKRIGPFGTLGMMEDTSALNDGAIDEGAFLQQAWGLYEERKAMFFHALQGNTDDVVVCVFDTPDRIQHMFWRHVDADRSTSPDAKDGSRSDVIERLYAEIDSLVGWTLERISDRTLLLVMSDHGFASFRRGVNLNTWLHQNGYLRLLPDAEPGRDWLAGVDWSGTKAYAIGLAGIFINTKGRESRGIVDPGAEFDELAIELKEALEALEGDAPADGSGGARRSIRRVLIVRKDFQGPYRFDGPDLIVGYEAGFRCSWACANGQVTDEVFSDNTLAWSGDHCIDPELVPGVIFANHPLTRDHPRIVDVAPTVLDLFGLAPEVAMQGFSLLREADG